MGVTNCQCELDGVQEALHGLIVGFGISNVVAALHNECCSETCLNDAGYDIIPAKQQVRLVVGLEKSLKAAVKIADRSGMVG